MKKLIPYKWELVLWLFIAFFFNQADRQIFNVLLLDIQNDLGLTPDKMGLVGTALILSWRIHPDAAPASEAAPEPVGRLMKDGLKAFFTSPTALLLALAGAGFQFSGQGFLLWMPTCLQDGFGVSATRAAFDASFYPQLASICGVLLGARLADRYVGKHVRARLWVQAAGFLAGAPFFYWIGASTTEAMVCAAMAGYGFFKGFYDSNIFASIYDVIDSRYRAMATSFILMFSLIIASASPYLLGVLKPVMGLSGGMKLMSGVYLLSVVPILAAIFFTSRKEMGR